MRNIFFVSDTHFGHVNIIKYCNRPYTTVEEMDEDMVKRWNDTVKPEDTIYHIGDWAFHNFHHIGRLNGNIISVPGNHDHERARKILPFLPNGFTQEVHYVKIDSGMRFVLCHYPFETWRREYKYHVHGHTHGIPDDEGKYGGYRGNIAFRLDAGWDANHEFRPLHLDEVITKMVDNLVL